MEIMIDFQGFNSRGRILFLKHNLEPTDYPTDFDALYQQMEFKENIYLQIEGEHTKNKKIGKYVVTITPILP